MKIKIRNNQKIKVSSAQVRKLVKFLFQQEGINKTDIEISIFLVDNKEIKEINKNYLNRNRTTDVISFRMWEGPFYKLHPELFGDVVVSVEKAKKQAERLNVEFIQELHLYIIHGLLHLLGYLDDTKRNAERMNDRCTEILREWEMYCQSG